MVGFVNQIYPFSQLVKLYPSDAFDNLAAVGTLIIKARNLFSINESQSRAFCYLVVCRNTSTDTHVTNRGNCYAIHGYEALLCCRDRSALMIMNGTLMLVTFKRYWLGHYIDLSHVFLVDPLDIISDKVKKWYECDKVQKVPIKGIGSCEVRI